MKKLFYGIATFLFFLLNTHLAAQNTARIVMQADGKVWYTDGRHLWQYDSSGTSRQLQQNVQAPLLFIRTDGRLGGISTGNDSARGSYYDHWLLNDQLQIDRSGDTINVSASTAAFTFDAKGRQYRYVPGKPGSIVMTDSKGTDSVMATIALNNIGNLHIGAKNILFFTSGANLYCIPPDEQVELVGENLADTAWKGNNLPLLRAVWSDSKKNLYIATGGIIRKVDHRRLVTTIYKSVGDWYPADGMVAANGDFYVLEYSRNGEARVNKISMEERKAIAASGKWKTYFLPLLLASAVALLLYFLFRPKRKA